MKGVLLLAVACGALLGVHHAYASCQYCGLKGVGISFSCTSTSRCGTNPPPPNTRCLHESCSGSGGTCGPQYECDEKDTCTTNTCPSGPPRCANPFNCSSDCSFIA
jgi:hypothetical protein